MSRQDAQRVSQIILRKRRVDKFISTYYERMLENRYSDGLIRGYFVHCSTDTGRLSSDQQQVPKANISKIKKMFISRYS